MLAYTEVSAQVKLLACARVKMTRWPSKARAAAGGRRATARTCAGAGSAPNEEIHGW